MRRLSRVLLPLGMLVFPFCLGIWHSVGSRIPYQFGSQNSVIAYGAFGALHLFVAHVAGIPDETEDVQPALLRSLFAAATATALWVVIQTIAPGLLPRRVIFQAIPVMSMWSFACSDLSLRAERRERRREGLIAILADGEGEEFDAEVTRGFPVPEIAFSVASTLQLDGLARSAPAELESLMSDLQPNLVVVSDAASRSAVVIDAVTELHRRGVKVRTLSTFYDEYLGKVSLSELSRMAMLFDVRNLHHTTYRRVKRAIDLCGGLLGGLACLVLLLPVLAVNQVSNRGPLLFRQQRVGLRGTVFTIVKFRTMVPTPAEEVGVWTRLDDPRVTPFGRVLRKTHLDELPQFWNMLRGELSLVGPRPEQPKYVEELSAKERAYELRHLVTPGLTGWAQVKLRYADSEAAAIEKLQYDLYYLQHQSLTLDFRILSRTLRSVIRQRGR